MFHSFSTRLGRLRKGQTAQVPQVREHIIPSAHILAKPWRRLESTRGFYRFGIESKVEEHVTCQGRCWFSFCRPGGVAFDDYAVDGICTGLLGAVNLAERVRFAAYRGSSVVVYRPSLSLGELGVGGKKMEWFWTTPGRLYNPLPTTVFMGANLFSTYGVHQAST
jgi:hypothetical protein